MGMLKEGVRLDRVRGGRQKYRRNPISSPYQLQMPQSITGITPTSVEDIKILEILSAYEPENLSCGHIDLMNVNSIGEDSKLNIERIGAAADSQKMLSVLSDIFDRELVGVIGWAKQIPGKKKNLRFECQN